MAHDTSPEVPGSMEKLGGTTQQGGPLNSGEASKMTNGSQDLREHDFHAPESVVRRRHGAPALAVTDVEPEHVDSGGKHGDMPSDHQKVGEIGAIMDQDSVDPDNFADN